MCTQPTVFKPQVFQLYLHIPSNISLTHYGLFQPSSILTTRYLISFFIRLSIFLLVLWRFELVTIWLLILGVALLLAAVCCKKKKKKAKRVRVFFFNPPKDSRLNNFREHNHHFIQSNHHILGIMVLHSAIARAMNALMHPKELVKNGHSLQKKEVKLPQNNRQLQ